jgi:hypothetical protein
MKKGPPEDQRPKSREETPKEGYEARAISLRCTLIMLHRTTVKKIFGFGGVSTAAKRRHSKISLKSIVCK